MRIGWAAERAVWMSQLSSGENWRNSARFGLANLIIPQKFEKEERTQVDQFKLTESEILLGQ